MKAIWSWVLTSLLVAGPIYAEDTAQDATGSPPPAQPSVALQTSVPDPIATAHAQLQEAETHLKEAQELVAQGNTDAAVGAIKAYETTMSDTTKNLDAAAQRGQDVSQALQAVDRATQKHTQVLADLLRKVPEQAQPAIQHALDVSQRGRTHALDNLRALGQAAAGTGHQPVGIGNMNGIESEAPGKSTGASQAAGSGRPTWSEGAGSPGGVGAAGGGWGGGHSHGRR